MHAPKLSAHTLIGGSRGLSLGLAISLGLMSLATPASVQATTRGDGLRSSANRERVERSISGVNGTATLDSIADKRADQMRGARKLEHDMDYVRWRLNKGGVGLTLRALRGPWL